MTNEDLHRVLGRPLDQCGSAEIAHISRRAHHQAANLPPIVPQEEWELERARAEARQLADDLRQTGKQNARIWDAPMPDLSGLQSGDVLKRWHREKQSLCDGWWIWPGALLGLFLWVAGIAKVLDMMRAAGWL